MIEKPWKLQKAVRLKADTQWQPIKDLADELAAERGSRVSVPDAIMESIKFYRENRPKMAGTPGGEVLGNAEDRTGTVKGNN